MPFRIRARTVRYGYAPGVPHVRLASALELYGNTMLYLAHGAIVALGAYGLIVDPSPSVASVIGYEIAATLWSVTFVVFGMLALFCRVARDGSRVVESLRIRGLQTDRAESLCVALIGFALFWFAVFIGVAASNETGGAVQTALALFSAACFYPGAAALTIAMLRREALRGVRQTGEILDQVRRTLDESQ